MEELVKQLEELKSKFEELNKNYDILNKNYDAMKKEQAERFSNEQINDKFKELLNQTKQTHSEDNKQVEEAKQEVTPELDLFNLK